MANDKVLTEIENLQQQIDRISSDLAKMRDKAQQDETISPDELQITVRNIEQLDRSMRDRSDVNH